MRIYFSGIGGVAIGPLAMIAQSMGYDVLGSDAHESLMTQKISQNNILFAITNDDGYLREQHRIKPINWIVYTAALPENHPQLVAAKELGIHVSKRDQLLNQILQENGLQLIAISGTHGKTTTTAMVVWLIKNLREPVSYSIGTNISFGPSGQYEAGSRWFVYEADEYDRNMLQFKPFASIIPSIDFDHPDTYATIDDYKDAFAEFITNSSNTYLWDKDRDYIGPTTLDGMRVFDSNTDISAITLAGSQNRRNAFLAIQCVHDLLPQNSITKLIAIINRFPGTERRFERLSDNIYTDYAHHPEEIKQTIALAREINPRVVAVYQPHQNVRQHQLRHMYRDCFDGAEKVWWLPTYLSRENEHLKVLKPLELIEDLGNSRNIAEAAELDDLLWANIQQAAASDRLVVLMSAGDLDAWARQHLS